MKIYKGTEYYYSPPRNGNITWIYPWNDIFLDIFSILTGLIFSSCNNQHVKRSKRYKSISNFFPIDRSIFTDSGRSAILLALKGLNIGAGDEVILCSFNCKTVIDPVINIGAKPILIDSDEWGKMRISQVNKYISKKTKAIIVSNIYGVLDNYNEILKIAHKNHIHIINDLCQSLIVPTSNTQYFKDKDSIYIFSFGPEKHLFALGGGALFSNDRKFIKKLSKILGQDVVKTKEIITTALGRIKYYFTFTIYSKFKSLVPILSFLKIISKFDKTKKMNNIDVESIHPRNMNSIQLDILSRKLLKLNCNIEQNIINYLYLKKTLSKIQQIKFIEGEILNPLYATIIVKGERYKLAQHLSNNGVPSVWNYIPLHKFPVYEKYGVEKFPYVEKLWKKVLSIPFNYTLDRKSLNKIALTTKNYYKK